MQKHECEFLPKQSLLERKVKVFLETVALLCNEFLDTDHTNP